MVQRSFLINANSELKESWQRFVSQHARWNQELQLELNHVLDATLQEYGQ